MRKRAVSPPTLPRPWANYSHAVRVTGGATVYVAGQVGWDREGRITSHELRGQVERTFANVAAALEAAGAGLADVVKLNVYMVDIDQFPVFSEVRNRLFPGPDFVFIMTWNEYMYAKVIGSTRFQTLPVYVLTLANQQFRSDAGILSAAALVTMAPVVGLVIGFQRLIVAGLTEGALKE